MGRRGGTSALARVQCTCEPAMISVCPTKPACSVQAGQHLPVRRLEHAQECCTPRHEPGVCYLCRVQLCRAVCARSAGALPALKLPHLPGRAWCGCCWVPVSTGGAGSRACMSGHWMVPRGLPQQPKFPVTQHEESSASWFSGTPPPTCTDAACAPTTEWRGVQGVQGCASERDQGR